MPSLDALKLKHIAARYLHEYPDIHAMAYHTALSILKKHTRRRLSPDQVYWHRFSTANTSPRTFTGWEHYQAPVESQTLVELVMRRFNAHDQQATDDLQVYGGFYTGGPDQQRYNETNEVAMLPAHVLQDFWAIDFSATYTQAVDRFWRAHHENFCLLAKAHLLAAAGLSLRKGSLPRSDFEQLTQVITGPMPQTISLAYLNNTVVAPAPLHTLHGLDLGGIAAEGALRMVTAQGRQLLYLPGMETALHAFDNEHALYNWVSAQLTNPVLQGAFAGNFLRSAAERDAQQEAFKRTCQQITAQPWQAGQQLLNRNSPPIAGDVFAHLRDIAHRQMSADAHYLLTSNATLRKQMWMGYLNAFIRVSGGLAPLGWPVALAAVGAGLANVGLSIDQAVNGATRKLRRAGVIAAVMNSIFVLFNLPLLAAGKAFVKPVLPAQLEPSLDTLVGNVVLDDGAALETTGPWRGIHRLDNGQAWITLDDLPYQVRFSQEHQGWVIIDPTNPYAFYGAKPVRLTAAGDWQVVRKPWLAGGMEQPGSSQPAAVNYSSTRSTFWDTYMQFNLAEEQRLSGLALLRQERAIPVYELSEGDEVMSDSEGDDVFTDAWGDQYRVYKTADDEYYGGMIRRYTREDAQFNSYLRTGKSEAYGEQQKIILRLADMLEDVGYNNDVALYRGGSGSRGTSGIAFRSGAIKPGDVLVNTDFTSFSENPYLARVFSSSQGGAASDSWNEPVTFDDTSVVFELPARSYMNATPIALFSASNEEAESLFTPGRYFQIDSLEEVTGDHYTFMKVQLREVDGLQQGHGLFDFRTGQPFSRQAVADLLGPAGDEILQRFFPQP